MQRAFGDTGLGLDNASQELNRAIKNALLVEKKVAPSYPQPHMVTSTLRLHASLRQVARSTEQLSDISIVKGGMVYERIPHAEFSWYKRMHHENSSTGL